MEFLKKYWYLVFITIITVGLGVVTFLTSQKLEQTTPVAPTVPQVTPRAAEPACTLQFTLAPTATPTPTPVPPGCGGNCGTGLPACPTDHSCSSGKCVLSACLQSGTQCDSTKCTVIPTPTPTATPTPTPTPNPQCGDSCGAGLPTCPNDHTCSSGKCVLTTCLQAGVQCSANNCSVIPTPTPTPAPRASCNNGCTVNSDCQSGLICTGGACRNPSCTAETNCTCQIVQATPTPVKPQVPVAGSGPSILGASIIGGGLLLILFGLAL